MQLVVPQHGNEDIWVDLGVLESRDVVERVEDFLNRLDASIFVGPLVQALRGRPHCNWAERKGHETWVGVGWDDGNTHNNGINHNKRVR